MSAAVNCKQMEGIFFLFKMALAYQSLTVMFFCKQMFILNVPLDILFSYVKIYQVIVLRWSRTPGTRPIHNQVLLVYPLTIYCYQRL